MYRLSLYTRVTRVVVLVNARRNSLKLLSSGSDPKYLHHLILYPAPFSSIRYLNLLSKYNEAANSHQSGIVLQTVASNNREALTADVEDIS